MVKLRAIAPRFIPRHAQGNLPSIGSAWTITFNVRFLVDAAVPILKDNITRLAKAPRRSPVGSRRVPG
jgi:hypothetical protein